MTESTRGAVPRALLLALSAAAAVLVVLALVLGAWKLYFTDKPSMRLNKTEQSAVDAAKQETINIQTYRLKSFDSDFSAALAGMTPKLATDFTPRKKDLLAGLQRLKQDNSASVSGAGLLTLNGNSAVVLVAADSLRTNSAGKTSTFAVNRFRLTMTLAGGKWLMDNIESVSLS
jgi:Mce-associated membrane protein